MRKRFAFLGSFIGFLSLVMIVLFFLMYSLFMNLFASFDITKLYHSQVNTIHIIYYLSTGIRYLFFIISILTAIYALFAFTRLKTRDRHIYIGLVLSLLTMALCLYTSGYMITLNNLSMFCKDVFILKGEAVIDKYDFIYSMIHNTAGYSSLLSKGSGIIILGMTGMMMLGYHGVYLLEYYDLILFNKKDMINTVPDYTIEYIRDEPQIIKKKEPIQVKHQKQRVHKTPLIYRMMPVLIVLSLMIGVPYGGYYVYTNYFQYTDIDLVSHIDFDYTGEDGNASITNFKANVDYDKTNKEYKEFIKSVTYNYDQQKNLSNGDTFTITATYSKEKAKDLRIKIINNSKTFKVEGLVYRFASASELDDSLKTSIKNDIQTAFNTYYTRTYGNNSDYKYELDSIYFGKNHTVNTSKGDYAIGVYKVTYSYNAFFFMPTTQTSYLITYTSHINSDYNNQRSADNYYTSQESLYLNSATDCFNHDQSIMNALDKRFTNFTFTKIE